MKYKYNSMGRFIGPDFVFSFVERFLGDLITYKGFLVEEKYDEINQNGILEEKTTLVPLTYGYGEDEIELTSLNAYPFIEIYFFDKLEDFFKPVIKDKDFLKDEFRYLNDSELAVINNIGAKLPSDTDSYDPNIKTNKKDPYNAYYKDHTKEQVNFILGILSSLIYMLDTIEKDLNNHLLTILSFIYYHHCSLDDTPNKKITLNAETLGDLHPSKFKITSVKNSIFKNSTIDSVYKTIRKELLANYSKSAILKDEEYLDHLVKYKIIELQLSLIYAKKYNVTDNHLFCKKLDFYKVKEVFSKRFSEILTQKEIDTGTIIAWLAITPQTVSDYKKGKTLPDNNNLIILSKNLNVSVDYLLGLSDIKDYKLYPAWDSFKKFGYTSKAFDSLYFMKKQSPWQYSHLITTFNILLEEEGLKTITDITDFITHRLSSDYYTINVKAVKDLEDEIKMLIQTKKNPSKIMDRLSVFKNNLPLSAINNLDSTTLLTIQQDLINLKLHTVNNINIMEEHIQPYFEKFYIDDEDKWTNEEHLDEEPIDEHIEVTYDKGNQFEDLDEEDVNIDEDLF